MEEILMQAVKVLKKENAVHNEKGENLNYIERDKRIDAEMLQLIKGVQDSFSPMELGTFVKQLLVEAEKIKTIETVTLEEITS
ncbi:hypothetical protein CIL05_20010 [Virgibacillus profundi]|uniref:Uncharacterized protein n=1 Tax=Virgibacillus profundi TaxID=2024555 RepID=A0A2A2I937_9BACI|nr:hypothetical protein [Virgibacillus profundi]PAV27836.1 hypothetical protein CIL05_20010 [Virgibacillus profundi]PXY51963.1 hypothetical protein CIT14_20375 [Virgibacillus profundi]